MNLSAAFFVSLAMLVIGIGICIRVGRRRPPGTPFTWGEAFLAATFVFGLMLLAYGVVPDPNPDKGRAMARVLDRHQAEGSTSG